MHNESSADAPAQAVVIEGIARKRMLSATYNGTEMRLAPHQLFVRHGAFFVAALNVARVWRSDEEPRLGKFKLDGLSDLKVVDDAFEPLPTFDGSDDREGDEAVFSVLAA